MIYRILRYVIAILVGTAAYVGMDSLAPIIDPYLVCLLYTSRCV